ncbi:MAG: hypothetical protein C5S48_02785 [Candidatus Methanogaster sp.]|nr:MAG: hypothetical protein C5S48_02785 [ANME-2 cluster archaeon]
MYNLKLSSDWQDDIQNRFPLLEGTSIDQFNSGSFRQVETDFRRMGSWLAYPNNFSEHIFHRPGLTSSNSSIPPHSKPFLSDEIVIVPLRELSYSGAKKEISEYIKKAGDRKVYISELAEELLIDFELIEEIIEELEMCKMG